MSLKEPTFEQLLEQEFATKNLRPDSIVQGQVISINNDFVTVDTGHKSEGIIPAAECQNLAGELEVAVGDTIDVVIEVVEDGLGQTRLSREKARRYVAWGKLLTAYDNNEIIIGRVVDRVKGGFTIDLEGNRAFLPGSLADVRPIRDPALLENTDLELKIVKMDQKRNNIVVSRRAVLESENSEERDALLASLEEGQSIKGVVKNLTEYGAFIDLGGVDGLLHITDMSWKRVKHPSEIITVGEEIEVKVLSYDKEKLRVSLGLKQMQGDPWQDIARRFPENSRLFGHVTNMTEYGCFVEIEDGIEGLVHMSEMDWTNKNIHPNKITQVGEEVEVMVLEIDEKRRRISLGMKQCRPNPWKEFSDNYQEGQVVGGKIKSITDFGVFIGLEGGIDGLVHVSDISWTEPGDKAIRGFKKGDELEAAILTIDPERERISLSVRQMSDDPFVDYFAANPRATEVNGEVLEVDAKRAIIKLGGDIKGSIRISDLDSAPAIGDSLTAFVANDERKNNMVNLSSHKPTGSAGPSRKPKSAPVAKGHEETPENTTFGDLIKAQIGGDGEPEAEAKPAKAKKPAAKKDEAEDVE